MSVDFQLFADLVHDLRQQHMTPVFIDQWQLPASHLRHDLMAQCGKVNYTYIHQALCVQIIKSVPLCLQRKLVRHEQERPAADILEYESAFVGILRTVIYVQHIEPPVALSACIRLCRTARRGCLLYSPAHHRRNPSSVPAPATMPQVPM